MGDRLSEIENINAIPTRSRAYPQISMSLVNGL
ncbi:MAG: hypothetical protein RJA87_598 [Pseudomonadota bacterium]|jgi:hypothetical protein